MIKAYHTYSSQSAVHFSRDPQQQYPEVWLLLHGYHQLGQYFWRKFSAFDSDKRLFILPDAPNLSYIKGFQGHVGANWMTRYEREMAIANTANYLNSLLEKVLSPYPQPPKLYVLGFSQGAATASRWATQTPFPISGLALWGSGFAADIQVAQAKESLGKIEKLCVILGEQDEWVTPESLAKQEAFIQETGLPVQRLTFQGGHEIDAETFVKVIEYFTH
ncbi:phospholipase/carboxylesterase [Nitritalea halalkaliphila LW7]|uniref:Phospholipase/carboxylesterase n=1 Tax=Nitritalea halalkaliphila LW7 TaxID=1189621 RepID=I5BYZ9_9BACT|nr:phospholipase/carboxylesterase [Nitritalea halalkaliphila]EIM74801.1 phospholipase/carboxylesterase [Nitritalea halalkaliphila LW7]